MNLLMQASFVELWPGHRHLLVIHVDSCRRSQYRGFRTGNLDAPVICVKTLLLAFRRPAQLTQRARPAPCSRALIPAAPNLALVVSFPV